MSLKTLFCSRFLDGGGRGVGAHCQEERNLSIHDGFQLKSKPTLIFCVFAGSGSGLSLGFLLSRKTDAVWQPFIAAYGTLEPFRYRTSFENASQRASARDGTYLTPQRLLGHRTFSCAGPEPPLRVTRREPGRRPLQLAARRGRERAVAAQDDPSAPRARRPAEQPHRGSRQRFTNRHLRTGARFERCKTGCLVFPRRRLRPGF